MSWSTGRSIIVDDNLCGAIVGIAVPILLFWHLHLISRGETSIEAHDNEYFAKKAKENGMVYVNPYDLGKRRNLELFFNVGQEGQ